MTRRRLRRPRGPRRSGVVRLVVGLLLGLASSAEGAYVSEVFLPRDGAAAVEVSGLGDDGARLLVVDAAVGRSLRVRQTHQLPGRADTPEGWGVVLLAEPGWDAGAVWAEPATPRTTVEAYGLPLSGPTALVLLDGRPETDAAGRRLTDTADWSDLLDDHPVVDWVWFASGGTSVVRSLTPGEAEALGVAALPQPVADTDHAEALARARTAAGVDLTALLPGQGGLVAAGAAGYRDFDLSAGRLNPVTVAMPEPAVAGLLAAAACPGRRHRRRGC
ncbi:MAG: hypothetical protein AAF800_11700 [Planctomycetota bacterium]